MREMWTYEYNDQRPSVLDWITHFPAAKSVLDVGSGEAYYLDKLKPQSAVLIEPNPIFQKSSFLRCKKFCNKVEIFFTIGDFLRTTIKFKFEMILFIHSLLYANLAELNELLPLLKDKKIAMVYPSPVGSTTFQFQKQMNISSSYDKISMKTKLLGTPTSHRTVLTNFRLPLTTPDEDLAYLIAHPILCESSCNDQFQNALDFVQEHRKLWTKSLFLELPQAQILETFNFKPSY